MREGGAVSDLETATVEGGRGCIRPEDSQPMREGGAVSDLKTVNR